MRIGSKNTLYQCEVLPNDQGSVYGQGKITIKDDYKYFFNINLYVKVKMSKKENEKKQLSWLIHTTTGHNEDAKGTNSV